MKNKMKTVSTIIVMTYWASIKCQTVLGLYTDFSLARQVLLLITSIIVKILELRKIRCTNGLSLADVKQPLDSESELLLLY